jgi:hypothetical protein
MRRPATGVAIFRGGHNLDTEAEDEAILAHHPTLAPKLPSFPCGRKLLFSRDAVYELVRYGGFIATVDVTCRVLCVSRIGDVQVAAR